MNYKRSLTYEELLQLAEKHSDIEDLSGEEEVAGIDEYSEPESVSDDDGIDDERMYFRIYSEYSMNNFFIKS